MSIWTEVVTIGSLRIRASSETFIVVTCPLRWIQMEAPGPKEIEWLDEEYPFHELDLEDVRSRRQRPKVDDYPDYLFVVLHFPWYDRSNNRLVTAELNAFIGRDYLITIPNVPIKPLDNLYARLEHDDEARVEFFAKGSGYLFYEALDTLYKYCFPILDQIGRKLADIDDAIWEEDRSEQVVRMISSVKQEIISYRLIVKPQRPVLRLLERDTARFLPEDLEVYYDDLIDQAERIWDVLEGYKEALEGLESTNESAINHRQNQILRVLTVLTVGFMPMTFITGLFGMNVPVPWSHDISAFWAIFTTLCVSLGAMLGIARWMRWL